MSARPFGACSCGTERSDLPMPAIVRADSIHFATKPCEPFDQAGYVAYFLRFTDPERDALNPVQWHAVSQIGPTA